MTDSGIPTPEPVTPSPFAILYLEMSETITEPNSTIGVTLRVPVADRAAALALRDELAGRFFVGLAHTDQLHYHVPGGACTTEALP